MNGTKEKDHVKLPKNTEGADIVKEHCYVQTNIKKIICYPLNDHNYFLNRKPQISKKSKPQKKLKMKITELRAVYNCKICGYRTMDRELFNKHTCKQEPEKNVPCKICVKNIPDGYHRCPECTFFTKNKASLKIHMNIHATGKPYKCTECEFCGKNLRDLIQHYEDTKDLKCDCGFTTHVKKRLVIHQRTHKNERPFCCGVCNFSTANRATLQRHLKRHNS